MSGNSCKKMGGWKPYTSDAVYDVHKGPGVYEFKHVNANKPQYIGMSGNVNERIREHHSGKQHVDDYIRSNASHVDFRFKSCSSSIAARREEARRLEAFERQYGGLPDHNYKH